MIQNFGHPSALELKKEVAALFRDNQIFLALHTHVTFVCGGNKRTSLRNKFKKFIINSEHNLAIVFAEDAVNDLLSHNNPEFINLGEFEELIGDIFDSVLIFPESPGSIAELGYFSKSDNVRKKSLVANWTEYQKESFINLGPVTLINEHSYFKPAIFLGNKKNPEFKLLVDRLLTFSKNKKRRTSFPYKKYSEQTSREKLIIVFELINIAKAIRVDNLAILTAYVFYSNNEIELKRIVSILCAAGYVKRDAQDENYLVVNSNAHHFLEFNHIDISSISAKISYFYTRHDSDSFDAVKRSGK